MAFVRVARFPGATEQHFQALSDALRDVPAPAGRLVFAAGPVDGGWQVVQVWTDRQALAEFNAAHLGPALAALGPAGFPEPPVVVDSETAFLSLG